MTLDDDVALKIRWLGHHYDVHLPHHNAPRPQAEPLWIEAGFFARVLVVDGEVELVVYWEEAVPEMELPGGFFWFPSADPQNHIFLQEGDEVTLQGWETACELASLLYFEPPDG